MRKRPESKETRDIAELSPGSSTRTVLLKGSFRVAALYLAFGSLWILFSDLAVDWLVKDPVLKTTLSLAKGWIYVFVTAILLAMLIRDTLARILEYDRQFATRDDTIRNANLELLRYRQNLDSLVRERTVILQSKTEEANSASRAKSDFLSNVSHEIRTPLNAIVGLTHLLEKTKLDGKQSDYCTMMRNSSKVLLGIINDVLDFAKIESGKLELCEAPYSLEALAGRVRSILFPLITDKGLDLEISIDAALPDRLVGDELRLGQILLNLSMNAIKFTKRGYIRLSITDAPNLAPADGEVRLRFSVADTGIGIQKDKIARLFNAFTQADASTTKEYGGTGLGLTISKALVEEMGGTIGVESEVGVGSDFHFEIAQRIAESVSIESRETNDATVKTTTLPDCSALIVDDNEINLMVLEECLRESGLRIRSASGGREALALAESERFDVILLDLHMPDMDGITVARSIRARGDADQPIIIALTADADCAVRECVLGAGMNDFVTKPIDHDNLLVCLSYWLGRRAKASPGFTKP